MLTLVFITGVIYGVFSTCGGATEIRVSDMESDLLTGLIKTCIKNVRSLSFIILFSFSAFGVPVIIYLTYLEGFSLSVALSLIVTSANCGVFKGIVVCIPAFILNVIAFILMSKIGIELSAQVFKCTFLNQHKNLFNGLLRRYFYTFIVSLLIMFLAVFAETLIRKIFA